MRGRAFYLCACPGIQFEDVPVEHETPLHRDVLIGAKAIADEVGIDVRQCFHWLQNGYVPATKTGSTWTTTRSALRRHFSGEDRSEPAVDVIKAASPSKAASHSINQRKTERKRSRAGAAA